MTLQEYFAGNAELCARWDGETNAPLTPEQLSHGSKKQVWWRCEKGHRWQARVDSMTGGVGGDCPYCSGKRAIPGETDLATLYPELAAQWDGEKNGTLTPDTVPAAAHKPVWWKCECGHSWQAAPYSRTREKASGCPYCTGKKVWPGFNDLLTLRPKLAEQWYQPLNDDLTPEQVTPGSNKKVWWKCDEGHVWQTAIYSRTRAKGTGCPVCAGVAKARKIQYFQVRSGVRTRPAAEHSLKIRSQTSAR